MPYDYAPRLAARARARRRYSVAGTLLLLLLPALSLNVGWGTVPANHAALEVAQRAELLR